MERIRLHKVIANSGLCSRRKAEQLIKEGRVEVNDVVIQEMGSSVEGGDRILVDGKPLPRVTSVIYLCNKPRGVVSSRAQQGNERIITDLTPKGVAVYPVGRLDKESEGLILLTNDGELTHKLTHPSFEHEKEYIVLCKPEKSTSISPERIAEKLRKGVKLGDGVARADAITVRQQGEKLELRITLHEGRHHLIRRMCAAVNLEVARLTRVRIGILSIEKLPVGHCRRLTDKERTDLYASLDRSS